MNNELYHYGIKGMKWGVRRFQDKSGRLTSTGRKRYSDKSQKEQGEETKKDRLRLTDKQKKYIKIGAAVAATALVAYGGYKLYQNKDLIAMKAKMGKNNVLGNVKGFDLDQKTGLKLSSNKSSSISEAIKGSNPTGSNTNCRANSINVALRMMGFDTVSKDIPGGPFSEVINKSFKDAKIVEMYNPSKEKVSNHILKRYQEGDFGAVASTFTRRGNDMAHAFNWKIENGKVNFFDGQKELDDFSEYLNLMNPGKVAEIVKLNGLEINADGIKDFIENRK